MTEASELRGILVVAREEGAQLGSVTGIDVDTETRTIAAIRFRPRGFGRKESYVQMKDVVAIGRDVAFVNTEEAVVSTAEEPSPGRSLNDLQGVWVTTREGKHLGTVVDLDFDRTSWRIQLLQLANDRLLVVNPDDIRIGDEIVVPTEYEARVEVLPKEKSGFLGRIFGKESIEDLSKTLRRAVQRNRDDKADTKADLTPDDDEKTMT